MKVYENNGRITIENVQGFNLKNTFENGQCFRWRECEDGSYSGIAFGKMLNIKKVLNKIEIYPTNLKEYNEIWKNYFDMETDYQEIIDDLKGKDKYLDQAFEMIDGLRILKQEPWETTISFIISANNNIPRIKKIIETISLQFGEKTDEEHYAFPTAVEISEGSIQELRECGAGFRDKYIYNAACKICDESINLNDLIEMDTNEAKKILLNFNGIGNKVAECVLLFSMNKYDVFPEDTWVKKIVKNLYEEESKEFSNVRDFFNYKFGQYSGYAQQVLFYWARLTNLGVK
ncbi:MAG: 8-oxoguanine DNA glycosylase [Clostridiales bacterium]|nr:8-oxoguanine DNA glycosylase [Clostridiales bacterium]